MTKQMTWGRHPDYAGGQWIKLFKGRDIHRMTERRAQGFELRVMPEWFYPEETISRILSGEDRETAFIRAVTNMSGAKQRWKERAETGLSEEQLSEALHYELGIAGGNSCHNSINIAYKGAGLKIWASLQSVNPCIDAPIFEGKQTIAMAREIFEIVDPADRQMNLF